MFELQHVTWIRDESQTDIFTEVTWDLGDYNKNLNGTFNIYFLFTDHQIFSLLYLIEKVNGTNVFQKHSRQIF